MYLKSLTLRGFKSFASATTLRFEPGITCVVGPNGSGKSNVVDAFTWVMGQQGVKSLRGGKMEDVVFAGTAARQALGRAEVTLTIDNSDGALPIDYAEVTISRLLFRTGQSEYAINGSQCRLLDVQELLSDSGLGREMHVIVGQGHLDDILNSGPEARRALIEEAAGVLKHRRRKEKALRKLDAMQANLTRLVDLTTELGRQLKPLGRQAQLARKAAVIQADLRDARLRLLADDYVTLSAELDRDEADEAAATAMRAELETVLRIAREQEAELESAAALHAPRLAAAQETYFSLSSLSERLRAVADLAVERYRHLSAQAEPARPGRDPDELEREAAEFREQELELDARLAVAREQLDFAVSSRTAAESALAESERQLASRARAAAESAERLARMRGQADGARSRLAAAQEEAGRLASALDAARARAAMASQEYAELHDNSGGSDEDRAELAAQIEQASSGLRTASALVAELRKAEHRFSEQRAGLRARVTTLGEAVRRGADASAVLLADGEAFPGVLGPLADLITVADGAAEAVAAALGASASAIAVSDLEAAASILRKLRDRQAGRADLVIANGPGATTAGGAPQARFGGGVTLAADLVKVPDELAAAIGRLLSGVVVAPDLATGLDVIAADPAVAVVTADGDLIGAHWAKGGSAGGQSLLGLRAAARHAADQLAEAEMLALRAEDELTEAVASEESARQVVAQAQAKMAEVDAATAAVSGRLGALAGAAKAAKDEADRLAASITAAEVAAEKTRGQLAEIEQRIAAEADEDVAAQEAVATTRAADHDDSAMAGQVLADTAADARGAEMDARLEVRTLEERLRAISGRADQLTASAQAERQAAVRAADLASRRAAQAQVAGAVADGAKIALTAIRRSLLLADAERQQAETSHQGRDEQLKAVRSRIREASGQLDKVVSTAHGAEVSRASRRLKLEQVEARAAEEFAIEVAALMAEYGPDVPIPSADPDQPPAEYDRQAQRKRADAAQRQLDQLGKVNPLALEEFAALEERHAFLQTQLDDLRKTRRDLLTVVKEVDDRVQQVFADAFADTAREFGHVFATLFPGGEGRLILTEPDDMLATGIEFEARPPGKKVKRLSLLSGGERSLTAIAFPVSIFKARPSPFYVMDEVEAALDDTNVQRLLDIFEELRASSQLIIVTHQKRTMEIADSLYGVSMRSDGVSAVISQRLREPAAAS